VFSGKVAHDEMPGVLAAMDVGVAPYLNAPDFYFSPLKLYEYMATGLAVVASDAGEISTLVRDGQTGLLHPPGDSRALGTILVRVLRDARLRTCLGAAARTEAERHTWQENARTVATLASTLAADRLTRMRTALPERGQP
jgi:glycosyltransferase involved in cell wall biosynthesis